MLGRNEGSAHQGKGKTEKIRKNILDFLEDKK